MGISSVNLNTSDLYYICQMVDGVTSDPFAYSRHIEDFAGDMACSRLLQSFPKWTPLHDFIETVVISVAHEDSRIDRFSKTRQVLLKIKFLILV